MHGTTSGEQRRSSGEQRNWDIKGLEQQEERSQEQELERNTNRGNEQ